MNSRHAQLILTIAREGSFTAAAKALYITQPTLSQTVKQIENQFGEPIFTRGRTPIELTPAGHLYVQAARRMLKIETQMNEAIAQLHGRMEGVLHLGMMTQRSEELLPQVYADFTAACPDVRIECVSGSCEQLERMLAEGELDMAFLNRVHEDEQLEYSLIASEEMLLLANKKTALAQRIPSGSTIGLLEAKNERFVLPNEGTAERAMVDKLLTGSEIKAQSIMTCDSVQLTKRICMGSEMVCFSPFISLLSDRQAMQQLSYYRLNDAFLPSFYMVHAKDQPLTPYGQMLYTLMSNRFRAMTAYRA